MPSVAVTTDRKLTEYRADKLVLVADLERDCDMPACHQRAIFQEVSYRVGHEWVQGHKCGFHGAALYGRREAV